VTIDSEKPTPEAQLQSFFGRFDPAHQKFIRAAQATFVVSLSNHERMPPTRSMAARGQSLLALPQK